MVSDGTTDDEFLVAQRKALKESVQFFASANRRERELWVAREFLHCKSSASNSRRPNLYT